MARCMPEEHWPPATFTVQFRGTPAALPPQWREQQLAAVRRVHAEVYAQVAGDRSWV